MRNPTTNYSDLRYRQLEAETRSRDLGSDQKADRLRETANRVRDNVGAGENFPVRNEELIRTSYLDKDTKNLRDVSRTYDTPFK